MQADLEPIVPAGANFCFKPPEDWNEEKHGKCSDLNVIMQGRDTDMPRAVSFWKPSEEVLDILTGGGVIQLTCVGSQPPVMLTAVDWMAYGGDVETKPPAEPEPPEPNVGDDF